MRYIKSFIFISIITMTSCDFIKNTKNKTVLKTEEVATAVNNSYKKTKSLIITPDSVLKRKKLDKIKNLKINYPEYIQIEKFFNSNSFKILEKGGEFYKILDLTISDNGSIIHNKVNEEVEFKYFYITDKNYYIYSFSSDSVKNIDCQSVRRVKKGYFSQPVHDLIFDENRLLKEEFVSNVENDFYKEGNNQFFSIEKKVEDSKIKNVYKLTGYLD